MTTFTASRCAVFATLALAVLGQATPARAQALATADWEPLLCGFGPMVDSFRDEPEAVGPRDLIGADEVPAGFRAADDDFLYLRLRLDESPLEGADVRSFGWGVAVDLDDDVTRYDLLLAVDGASDQVHVMRNTAETIEDSPRDPADEPPVVTYPFGTHGRVDGADSEVLTTPDFFLEFAVAWADLAPLGLTRDKPVYAWAGSSTVANRLDGDLACHDARGGDSDPSLSGTVSDRRPLDPREPSLGSRLEGGAGCSATPAPSAVLPLALLAVMALGARRRSGSARTRA